MKAKALEIRDVATFIAVLAVDMNPHVDGSANHDAQFYLLRRCGYACDSSPNILITRLDGDGLASNDPYSWSGRTWPVSHKYIIEHWDELNDGDVIDVEYILGEKSTKKVSERYER